VKLASADDQTCIITEATSGQALPAGIKSV